MAMFALGVRDNSAQTIIPNSCKVERSDAPLGAWLAKPGLAA
jgi:hypothetical protein